MKDLELIIKKCRKNDRVAQNTLFKYFADYIMNLTRRYIESKFDAKEIFLESFEIIFRKLDQYDPNKGQFKSWISKITIRQCLAFIKKRKLVLTDDILQYDSQSDDHIIESLEAEYLIELINNLGKPYNLIFNMVVDGYKHKEIGELLNIEASTSRSYYLRARIKLKEEILTFNKNNLTWSEEII